MSADYGKESVFPLDGNAAGGMLSELFAFDVTTARATCDGCGTTVELAEARVFGGTMGVIFRCTHCQSVVARFVKTPRGYWLDMQGTRSLFVPAGGGAG